VVHLSEPSPSVVALFSAAGTSLHLKISQTQLEVGQQNFSRLTIQGFQLALCSESVVFYGPDWDEIRARTDCFEPINRICGHLVSVSPVPVRSFILGRAADYGCGEPIENEKHLKPVEKDLKTGASCRFLVV